MKKDVLNTAPYTCYRLPSGVLAIPSYNNQNLYVVPGSTTINKNTCIAQALHTEEVMLWVRNPT